MNKIITREKIKKISQLLGEKSIKNSRQKFGDIKNSPYICKIITREKIKKSLNF